MERKKQITDIVSFVGRHRESHASRVICRRALPDYDGRIDGAALLSLQDNLQKASDMEVAAFHDLVK